MDNQQYLNIINEKKKKKNKKKNMINPYLLIIV